MAEILAGGGIQNAFNDLGIKAKVTYQMSKEPYYEVWELDKKDLKALDEAPEWFDEWGWYRFAKGSNMGSAADFFTVNGQFMIGWESLDGNDTYDSLMDYFHKGMNVSMESTICAMAVDLGRANGMSMSKLFKAFEG